MAIASTNMTSTYNDIIVERSTELLMGKTVAGLVIANAQADAAGRTGNTIVYHRAAKGTVQNAAEGTGNSKTYATPVGSTDTLTLDYFKEVPLEADDLDQNVIGNREIAIAGYADTASKTLAQQIDSDILEDIFDDANIADNSVIGDPTTTINDLTFRNIRSTLIKQGVRAEDVVILLTPDHSAEAMGLDVFRRAEYNTAGTVVNGELPLRIYGMNVYMDAVNLPTVQAANSISGSSTTEFVSFAMHRDAVKFVMVPLHQPVTQNAVVSVSNIEGLALRSKTWYEPDLNSTRLVVDALYGVKLRKHATVQGNDNSLVVPILGGAS